MTGLRAGDEVSLQGCFWNIDACDGQIVVLRCLEDGTEKVLPTGVLLVDETFVGPAQKGPSLADQRLLDLMPEQKRRQAEFWYEQMYQVRYGVTPAERVLVGVCPPETTIAERLAAKQQELRRKGIAVSMTTMWRKYSGFKTAGIIGCADQRGLPGHTRRSRIDVRVPYLLDEICSSFTEKSTPSKWQVIEMANRQLSAQGIATPGRSTMYQLLDRFDRGRHIFGDATTRRSQANQRNRAFGKVRGIYPGEEVQLDATRLDAAVLTIDGQVTFDVDLALAIDVATRTISAAILRPKACGTVDAIELVSKSMVPQQMLPGWDESMSFARSYLSPQLLGEDELAEWVAARPILDIRGVFVDRGKVFVSKQFERVLEARGINHRLASPGEPTAKPIVERVIKTIGDDFIRWIPGYTGRSVAHRGSKPEKEAVWPLPLLQALLDEWVVSVYQNRPHRGLSVDLMARKLLSPNDMYRALSEVVPGQVRILTRDEWISLQPCEWRRINRSGINLFRLKYDSKSTRFHRLRRTKSRNRVNNGRWEIRYDPGNLMRIWVRDDEENTWIECHWVLAQHNSVPFGLDVLRAVLTGLHDPRRATDLQVLQRTEYIHERLLAGPAAQSAEGKRELTAASRNLTQLAIRSGPPAAVESTPAATPDSTGVDLAPSVTTDGSVSVPPLLALRTTDDW
jgi:hypothetical protein